jgi:hypothetical protein
MRQSVPVKVDERLGASLRRAPYVWLVATLLGYFLLIEPLEQVVDDSRHASTAWAVVGAVMIAWGTGLALFAEPRMRAHQNDDKTATLRWVLAVSPFLLGYGATAVGGQSWVYALGFIVSLALLIRAARSLKTAG